MAAVNVAQPPAPPKRKERGAKGTFTRPNANENIMCVAKVLSRLAQLGDAGMSYSPQHLFKSSFPPQPERSDPDHIAYTVSPQTTVTRSQRSHTTAPSPSAVRSTVVIDTSIGVGFLDTSSLDTGQSANTNMNRSRTISEANVRVEQYSDSDSVNAQTLSLQQQIERDKRAPDSVSEHTRPLLSATGNRSFQGWWGTPCDVHKDWATAFDIDHYLPRQYNVLIPTTARAQPFTVYKQSVKKNKVPKPTVQVIASFIRNVFEEAHLNPECCINALVLVERLLEQRTFMLNARNWIPIILTSLLISSKTCDDLSSWNVEFSEIFPIFPVRIVNHMEREFLTALSYNLFVSTAVYANYYYYLRALRETPVPVRSAPKQFIAAQFSMMRSGLRGPSKIGTPAEQFVMESANAGGPNSKNDGAIVSL